MKNIKIIVVLLTFVTITKTLSAFNKDDVFFFIVPNGYDITSLSKTLSVDKDTLIKYNPKINEGLTSNMQLYIPAILVKEENLSKVASGTTFVGGALNSVYEYHTGKTLSNVPKKSIEVDSSSSHIEGTLTDIQTKSKSNTAKNTNKQVDIKSSASYRENKPADIQTKSKSNTEKNANKQVDIKSSDSYRESKPAYIPTKFNSIEDLNKFLSEQPQFKYYNTSLILTLTYSNEQYTAFVNNKELGQYEIDLNPQYKDKALIGIHWIYGLAPMLLSLNGENSTIELLPVENEGYSPLSIGPYGQLIFEFSYDKHWMKLSLGMDGISFTPVDEKPQSQLFNFYGFSQERFITNAEKRIAQEKRDKEKKIAQEKQDKEVMSEIRRLKEEFNKNLKRYEKDIYRGQNIEKAINDNPLLNYISNFEFYGFSLESSTTTNPSNSYSIIVNNRLDSKSYTDFWNGIMQYVNSTTMKVKPEYASPYIKDAFIMLYCKTMNRILARINFRKGEGHTLYSYIPTLVSETKSGSGSSLGSIEDDIHDDLFHGLNSYLKTLKSSEYKKQVQNTIKECEAVFAKSFTTYSTRYEIKLSKQLKITRTVQNPKITGGAVPHINLNETDFTERVNANFDIIAQSCNQDPKFLKFFSANNIDWSNNSELSKMLFIMTSHIERFYTLQFNHLPSASLYLWINGKKYNPKKNKKK